MQEKKDKGLTMEGQGSPGTVQYIAARNCLLIQIKDFRILYHNSMYTARESTSVYAASHAVRVWYSP